jgi:uncharacterized coiled-coil DUF342 family protein
MKTQIRKWLGIDADLQKAYERMEELNYELIDKLTEHNNEINSLRHTIDELGYKVEDLPQSWDVEDMIRDIAYHDIDDIKSDLEDVFDYDEIRDVVFDLVMDEIENRDTLEELVRGEIENLPTFTESTSNPVDITEIVEDVVEELINKLRA